MADTTPLVACKAPERLVARVVVPVAVKLAAVSVPVNVGEADRTVEPVPVLVVTPVPPLATGSVPLTWDVRLTPESVPPRVRLPDVDTLPVSVMPFTVPVPVTLVTVPPPPLTAANVPPENVRPLPIVTFENPPAPLP
jgi:hypothetical protein